MSNNIIIFDTESIIHDESALKNEKELFYENIKKNSKLIEHAEGFYFMDKYNESHVFSDSSIESILIKQLLNYVTPILEEIPSLNIERKRVGEIQTKKKLDDVKKNYSILVSTDNPIECELKSGMKFKVSSNEDILIIGIKLSKNLDKINTNNFYIPLLNVSNILDTHLKSLNELDVFESGSYGLLDYSTDLYFKYNSNISNNTELYFSNDKKKNIQILTQLKNIIENGIKYYETNLEQMVKFVNDILKSQINQTRIQEYTSPKMISNISDHDLSIITKLNSIVSANFLYLNNSSSLLNLFNSGLYDYFNKLHLDIKNKQIYDELNYRKLLEKSKREQLFNKFKKQLELFKKSIISLNKFGTSDILSLDEKQLSLINKEYNKLIEEQQDVISELPLIYKLYEAIEKDDKKEINNTLDSINNIVKLPKVNDLFTMFSYIKNKKGQNIICPHTIAKADALLLKYKNYEDKNNKIKDVLLRFASPDQESGIFCRICGEKIIDEEIWDITLTSLENYSTNKHEDVYDNLYFSIYKEISYIFNNFIDFKTIISDISKIIRNIVDVLKGEIRSIESSLIKVKTLSKENSASILNIYIYVYAFAFITQLIYTNDNISFKKTLFRGGKSNIVETKKNIKPKISKDIKPKTQNEDIKAILKSKIANTESNKKRLQSLMSDAISLIKKIKYQDIQKSDTIHIDSIKPLFLKAYRWILNINYTYIESSKENYFIQNSVIDYFIYANNQAHYNNKSEYIHPIHPYLLPFVDEKFFKNVHIILGRKYDQIDKDIVKNVSIFNTLQEPKKWNNNVYTNDSIVCLYDYIKNELFFENVSEKNDKLNHFYEKYKYIHELEEKNRKEFKKTQLKPFISINMIIHSYAIRKLCQCEQKFVFRKVDKKGKLGPKHSFSKEEINKWLEEKNYTKIKEFNSMELFFEECSCKKINDNISIFYKYYQEVCPLGELHVFDNLKCKKCGITNQIIEEQDIKFYNKFKDKFDKIRKRKRIEETPVKKIHKLIEFPKWEINTDSINKFSKKFNIPILDIYNMGLYEKQEYDEVKSKKINLSEELSDDDHIKRNNTLFDYYLYVIRNYYILRSSEFTIDLPFYIRDLLKKFSNKDIIKKLTVINEDFIDKYKYYKKTLSPKNLTNFLLNALTQLFLDMIEIFINKNIKQMGEKFIDILYKNISEFDRNLSKFSVKRFVRSSNIEIDENIASKETDELEAKADDYDDSLLEDEIVKEKEEEEIIEEEPEDIFSLNDVDIEDYDEDTLYKDVMDKID